MKKILLGIIVVGLFTLVGCKKDEGNSSSGIQNGSGVTDIDGNIYTSVIIGNQEWMVENLRTTKYSDGTPIPNDTVVDSLNYLPSGACFNFEYDSKYESTYGKLYNWYAVETGKLAPKGWHVPTDAEWKVLTDYLAANGHTGTEGTALKSKSGWNDNWHGTSGNGTDNYGWNGLPGGFGSYNGNFTSIGGYGTFWSSSEYSTLYAWYRGLDSSSGFVDRSSANKNFGFSVRCLRD